MPKLSFFNDIFREPWMIEPQTAAAQRQVLVGMLSGLKFYDEENETKQNSIIGHREDASIPSGNGINVVYLVGTMFRDDTECGGTGTRTIARQLFEADANPKVIGHIMHIDSGGGAANSVPDLAEAIQACTKPVVAYVDGYMCSAAMYAGSYCDYIMAHREEDKIGCIGTMIELDDWPRQAKDSNGFVHIRVYADGSEEKNSEYESALEGDFKLIKERILNPTNERFKAAIRTNRPEAKNEQLKGRTYNASETVGTLIDGIGTMSNAIGKVIELSNHNITTMKGHENLQSLETCRDLQMVDGYVSLNGEQLAEIDATLGEAATERALHETDAATITSQAETIAEQLTTINDLTSERDNLQAQANEAETLRQQVTTLTTERDTLRNENAQQTQRIAELEAALDGNPDGDDPMQAMHNGNPDKVDSFKELTDQEAMEYARKVVRGEI